MLMMWLLSGIVDCRNRALQEIPDSLPVDMTEMWGLISYYLTPFYSLQYRKGFPKFVERISSDETLMQKKAILNFLFFRILVIFNGIFPSKLSGQFRYQTQKRNAKPSRFSKWLNYFHNLEIFLKSTTLIYQPMTV